MIFISLRNYTRYTIVFICSFYLYHVALADDVLDIPTGFLSSIRNDSLDDVEKYLENGIDPNSIDRYGHSALGTAVQDGCSTEMFALLLDYGVDLNGMYNSDSLTSISLLNDAIKHDRSDIVAFALQNGADANLLSNAGSGEILPLALASTRTSMESIFDQLTSATTDIDAVSTVSEFNNITALHLAAYNGNKFAYGTLLANGADWTRTVSHDSFGSGITTLMLAAIGNNIEILNDLISKGADVTTKLDSGMDAYTFAKYHLATQTEALLKTYRTDSELREDLLKEALHAEIVKKNDLFRTKMAALGGVSSLSDEERRKLLSSIIYSDNVEAMQYLINEEIDITSSLDTKKTPLALACGVSTLEMANLLISSGADINAYPPGGTNPIYWAAVFDKVETLNRLLDLGASVTAHVPLPCQEAIDELSEHPETYAILQQAGYLFE